MKSLKDNQLPYDGNIYVLKNYISFKRSEELKSKILSEIEFRSDKIQIFGQWYDQARKVAWYGDPGIVYTYSKIRMETKKWSPTLRHLKKKICLDFDTILNTVLVNYYRNGDDYMSYHSDNEKELGNDPSIVSLSLGERRDFYLKHNQSNEVVKFKLGEGDLLIMSGVTQSFWKHSLPKRKNVHSDRLNLTFRKIHQSF